MWKSELKNLAKNKMLLISLIAVACIPVLYATLFLGSIWDPYGKTENLQVAVVNNDKSVRFGDTTLAVGDDLENNLKKNDAFDWQFVSASTAQKGLKDGTYYMVLTIPKDFSENASTVLDDEPKKMKLSYETNPGRNLISDVIMSKGATAVNEQLRDEVTQEYAKSIFAQITVLGDGVSQAAAGSKQINEGLQQVASGNEQISQNLEKLGKGTLEFSDGAQTLSSGVSQYLAAEGKLAQGVAQVARGAKQLNSQVATLPQGTQALEEGATTLQAGVTSYTNGVDKLSTGAKELDSQSGVLVQGADSVNKGIDTLAQQTRALPAQAQALDQGAQKLKGGLGQAQAGAANLSSGATSVDSGLTQLSGALPSNQQVQDVMAKLDPTTFKTLDDEQQTEVLMQAKALLGALPQVKGTLDTTILPATSQLSTGSKTLSDSLATLSSGATELSDATGHLAQSTPLLVQGIQQASDGVSQMDSGVKAYTSGTSKLDEGIATLAANSGQLQTGSAKLSNGIARLNQQSPLLADAVTQLSTGSAQLEQGASQLTGNNVKLISGTDDLVQGAGTIHEGSALLLAGSTQLGSGLDQLSSGATELSSKLSDGAEEAQAIHPSQATYSMIASPTQLDKSEYRSVSNYGNGLAPYFLSLVLYVGAIAFSFIYPVKKPSSKVTSPGAWWASKALVVAGQGIAQALLVDFFMVVVLNLQVTSLPKLILVTCLVSLTYMMVVTVLSVAWGNVGRFVATVFMVVQMACTGGMFPINLSGGFYQFMNPLLPMTYSAYGYREALTGVMGTPTFLLSLGVLAIYLVAAAGALYLVFRSSWQKGTQEDFDLAESSNRIATNEGVVGAR